jgi:hypothetical protein
MPSYLHDEIFSLLEQRFREKSHFYLKIMADLWPTGLSGKNHGAVKKRPRGLKIWLRT